MNTNRRAFFKGMFAVAAVAAVPIDRVAAFIGKPTNLAPALRARYSDVVAQALAVHSARLSENVTRNNALLERLQARAKA